jgi:hypothetical protein
MSLSLGRAMGSERCNSSGMLDARWGDDRVLKAVWRAGEFLGRVSGSVPRPPRIRRGSHLMGGCRGRGWVFDGESRQDVEIGMGLSSRGRAREQELPAKKYVAKSMICIDPRPVPRPRCGQSPHALDRIWVDLRPCHESRPDPVCLAPRPAPGMPA